MDYPLSRAVELGLQGGKFTEGVPGLYEASIDSAETMNDVIDEILAVQAEGGQVPDETKKTQLRDAIKAMIDAQSGNFCLDAGAANAYVVALDPPISAYVHGLTVRFRVAHVNTGASTLDAGAGPVDLRNDVDGALLPGDLPLGAIATGTYVAALGRFNLTSLVPSQTLTQGSFTGSNQSLSTNGYQKLPGGLIIQWLSVAPSAGDETYTLPIAFPSVGLAAAVTPNRADQGAYLCNASFPTLSQIRVTTHGPSGTAASTAVFIIAVGI